MNFSEALIELKKRKKIRRRIWVGSRDYNFGNLRLINEFATCPGPPPDPWIAMRFTNGCIFRWEPTHDDILSDDWEVLERPKRNPNGGWIFPRKCRKV